MKLETFFARHPVFTIDELRAYLAQEGEVNPRSLESLLAYHVGEGHLGRVRRGLYAVVPAGREGEPVVDPFVLASRLAKDAVLAYHSALELSGIAYTMHGDVRYLTARRARRVTFGGLTYRPVCYPKPLVETGSEQFAVRTVDRVGVSVRVTSLERTLVDVLDRPELSGGWEEAWRSLEGIQYLDPGVVVEYCRLLEKATTAAKVGLFLEAHEQLRVDEATLTTLEAMRPVAPHYAFEARGGETRMASRWNLLVPASLVDREWEEPA